jgi:hypothetical protein
LDGGLGVDEVPLLADAAHEAAVGDAGGDEEGVGGVDEVVDLQDAVEVVADVDRSLAFVVVLGS